MKNMLIIKDLKNWFWSTYPNWETPVSLDVEYIKNYFMGIGFLVEITDYQNFDFTKDYSDYVVLYASAEDYCGGSKAFMEDVLVHLKLQNASLLPEFQYFRAHDNKVMMEILRNQFQDERLKTIRSSMWPSLEKLKASPIKAYPVIIKRADGAGGEGVFLAKNEKELYKYAEKVSRMTNLQQFYYLSCVNVKQRMLGKNPVPIHNTKFITQNFIKGLDGDYKVLVFGEHYFVLHRLNRKNDFRASGSGYFTADEAEIVNSVLDFAMLCTKEISSPWLSLDICHDGSVCHLIEFQCISFGFKAMSMSKQHYIQENGCWRIIEGTVLPEEEFCESVRYFLEKERKVHGKR